MKFITSRDNPAFKHLRALLEDSRARREAHATLIDGEHLLQAAIEAAWPVKRLILSDALAESTELAVWLAEFTRRGLQAPEVLFFSEALFRQLSPVTTPTGILAEITLDGPDQQAGKEHDVLVLAGVQDAGNLGTLMRSAVAAGVRQVWLDRQCAQPWSPKALRAGMGAQFHLAMTEACDLAGMLSADERQVVVTSLGAQSISLYELDLCQPTIWVFGSEGQGVPAALLELADRQVCIPMPGTIESLNVGAAAAICLFEQVRQRMA